MPNTIPPDAAAAQRILLASDGADERTGAIDLPGLFLRACAREGLGRHAQIAQLLNMSESQVSKAFSWDYPDNPVLKGASVRPGDPAGPAAIKLRILRTFFSLGSEATGMELGTLSQRVRQIEQVLSALKGVLGDQA